MHAPMPASWSGTRRCSVTRWETGDDLTFDERDSAPFVPKCVVVDPNFDWRGQSNHGATPWDSTILYEAHVKGLTMRHPGVPEHLRGTYAGRVNSSAAFTH